MMEQIVAVIDAPIPGEQVAGARSKWSYLRCTHRRFAEIKNSTYRIHVLPNPVNPAS